MSRPAAKVLNNKNFIVVNPIINWFSAMISIGFARVNVFLMQCLQAFVCYEADPRTALSPKTREKAVPDQGDVGWPSGMLREYPLLSADAVVQIQTISSNRQQI